MNITAQLSKNAPAIDAALEAAEIQHAEFFKMVCETPNLLSVRRLLRGINDDPELVELITKYLTFIK